MKEMNKFRYIVYLPATDHTSVHVFERGDNMSLLEDLRARKKNAATLYYPVVSNSGNHLIRECI